MKKILLTLALLGLASGPALADSSCYTPEEAKAENLLRLHSELMVITVTCHQGSDGRDLVSAYTGFTRNNINMLHEAEATMTSHYKKAYRGDAVSRLDKLRTLLANEYGKQIADVSAPRFCAVERDKVTALYNSDRASILGEVDRMQASARAYEPSCGKVVPASYKKRG